MAVEKLLMPVQIIGIAPFSDATMVVLMGQEDRAVPIAIGCPEGKMLARVLSQISFPRPLTHTLFQQLLEKVKGDVHRLVIHALKEGTFHAYLHVQTPAAVVQLDCRPSDGMIVAALIGAPIYVTPEVMEEAGTALGDVLEETAPNEPAIEPGVTADEGKRPAVSELDRLTAQLERLVARRSLRSGGQAQGPPAGQRPAVAVEQLEPRKDTMQAEQPGPYRERLDGPGGSAAGTSRPGYPRRVRLTVVARAREGGVETCVRTYTPHLCHEPNKHFRMDRFRVFWRRRDMRLPVPQGRVC